MVYYINVSEEERTGRQIVGYCWEDRFYAEKYEDGDGYRLLYRLIVRMKDGK